MQYQRDSAPYAAALKRFRHDRGVSLRALAERTGIGHTLLVRSEVGTRRPASVEEVQALATGLTLSSGERDELLAAAGFWPADLVELGPGDPTLRTVARLLASPAVPTDIKARFRAAVHAVAGIAAPDEPDPQPQPALATSGEPNPRRQPITLRGTENAS